MAESCNLTEWDLCHRMVWSSVFHCKYVCITVMAQMYVLLSSRALTFVCFGIVCLVVSKAQSYHAASWCVWE